MSIPNRKFPIMSPSSWFVSRPRATRGHPTRIFVRSRCQSAVGAAAHFRGVANSRHPPEYDRSARQCFPCARRNIGRVACTGESHAPWSRPPVRYRKQCRKNPLDDCGTDRFGSAAGRAAHRTGSPAALRAARPGPWSSGDADRTGRASVPAAGPASPGGRAASTRRPRPDAGGHASPRGPGAVGDSEIGFRGKPATAARTFGTAPPLTGASASPNRSKRESAKRSKTESRSAAPTTPSFRSDGGSGPSGTPACPSA